MNYWIKSLGTAGRWLDDDWYHNHRRSWFGCPKHGRPSFEVGDRVLLYATGHQKLIGAIEVTSEARLDPQFVKDEGKFDGDRWPWVVEFTPLLIIPLAPQGPHVTRAGVDTLSMRSRSHLLISASQYRKGVAGLAEVAGLPNEPFAALAA